MLILDLIKEYILILKNILLGVIVSPPQKYLKGNRCVILLPGYNENWYFLKTIADRLNGKGHKIVAKWGYSTFQSIEYNSQKLSEFIIKNDLKEVVLISHSKGGLVGDHILRSHAEAASKLSKLVTIATPYKGSILGFLSLLGLSELSLGKQKFMSNPLLSTTEIINFYPKFDNHVIPNKNLIPSENPEIKNIKVDVNGHTRILESKKLLEILCATFA